MVIFVDVAIFDEIAVTFVAIVAGMVLDIVNSLKLKGGNHTLDQILLYVSLLFSGGFFKSKMGLMTLCTDLCKRKKNDLDQLIYMMKEINRYCLVNIHINKNMF